MQMLLLLIPRQLEKYQLHLSFCHKIDIKASEEMGGRESLGAKKKNGPLPFFIWYDMRAKK